MAETHESINISKQRLTARSESNISGVAVLAAWRIAAALKHLFCVLDIH
jgi:hypothetical protein